MVSSVNEASLFIRCCHKFPLGQAVHTVPAVIAGEVHPTVTLCVVAEERDSWALILSLLAPRVSWTILVADIPELIVQVSPLVSMVQSPIRWPLLT